LKKSTGIKISSPSKHKKNNWKKVVRDFEALNYSSLRTNKEGKPGEER
jgi:hypothetical protein